MKDQNVIKRIGTICFIAMMIVIALHIGNLIRFKQKVFHVQGNAGSGSYMEIHDRENSTSTWLKRSFKTEDGRVVDLIGMTVDETLHNDTRDEISEWQLRINIRGNCYINQAWNGEVDIHQFTGDPSEQVQHLNLQDYSLEDVKLQYRYDGDLLIPLRAGDYVIYYPSLQFSEMPVPGGENIKMGMIFYYEDQLDLTDYELIFRYRRAFTQGPLFYLFVTLAVLTLLFALMYATTVVVYRRARNEMAIRKAGISCMSEIYDVIYIIHLATGEMIPVSPMEKIERERTGNRGAKEVLPDLIREDTAEAYQSLVIDFMNLDTLADRLKDRDSIVCEFISKNTGWNSIRFFAMDRSEEKPLENVLFTVQDINHEKKELQAIEERVEKAESMRRSQDEFLSSLSREMKKPMRDLLETEERILRESGEEPIREYASHIRGITSRLVSLIEGILDSSANDAGVTVQNQETFSLGGLITELLQTARPLAEERRVELKTDIAEMIPDQLEGDPSRMREIIVNLLAEALSSPGAEQVCLSIYGKALETKVHLLVSIRTARCASSSEADGPRAGAEDGKTGLGREIAAKLLAVLGSGLKSVPPVDGWEETYFETELRIMDNTPVGKLSPGEARS